MNREWKWVNQYQPQTLVIGTILCYWNAISNAIFGMVETSALAGALTIIGLAAGGFGIANEKRWGYAVAVIAAVAQVLMLLVLFDRYTLTSALLSLVFDGALVLLLLHPMSREYQRIWFK